MTSPFILLDILERYQITSPLPNDLLNIVEEFRGNELFAEKCSAYLMKDYFVIIEMDLLRIKNLWNMKLIRIIESCLEEKFDIGTTKLIEFSGSNLVVWNGTDNTLCTKNKKEIVDYIRDVKLSPCEQKIVAQDLNGSFYIINLDTYAIERHIYPHFIDKEYDLISRAHYCFDTFDSSLCIFYGDWVYVYCGNEPRASFYVGGRNYTKLFVRNRTVYVELNNSNVMSVISLVPYKYRAQFYGSVFDVRPDEKYVAKCEKGTVWLFDFHDIYEITKKKHVIRIQLHPIEKLILIETKNEGVSLYRF